MRILARLKTLALHVPYCTAPRGLKYGIASSDKCQPGNDTRTAQQLNKCFEVQKRQWRLVGGGNEAVGVSWASEASRSRAVKGSDRGRACAAEGGPAGVWGAAPSGVQGRGPGAEPRWGLGNTLRENTQVHTRGGPPARGASSPTPSPRSERARLRGKSRTTLKVNMRDKMVTPNACRHGTGNQADADTGIAAAILVSYVHKHLLAMVTSRA